MLFGVHNHYNNNSNTIGDFNAPHLCCLISEVPVRLTDQGIVIFNLDKMLDLNEKIKLANGLHIGLKKKYGYGLSFATSGLSDCCIESELSPFYKAMKEIASPIITIYAGSKLFDDEWIGVPEDLKVDHIVNSFETTASEIVTILAPSPEDKIQPPEGWATYERMLRKLYMGAKQKALAL
ncbi:MAG: hypothetical protein PHW63_08520 [Alphaproteobacteria bacterium]|nr:hypothetical protein [Alphaproteobacteria bacterium]